MKMRSVRYLIGEGFSNTWVNRLMSLASNGVQVAWMVVIGLLCYLIFICLAQGWYRKNNQ